MSLSSTWYMIEVLENIRKMKITLFTEAPLAMRARSSQLMEFQVVAGAGATADADSVDRSTLAVELPVICCNFERATLARHSNRSVITLCMKPLGEFDSLLLLSREREKDVMPQPRLHMYNNEIRCRQCDQHVIITGSEFATVSRLPSPYWLELAELWGCHTETFKGIDTKNEIQGQKGLCYVGDYHLLLHEDDVLLDRDEAGCPTCSASLGSYEEGRGWKIHIDAITDGRNFFEQQTTERRLARSLFEISQSTGILRYRLSEHMFIILMSWDSVVLLKDMPKPLPCLRVRFSENREDVDLDDGRWMQLDWSATECSIFSNVLQERHTKTKAGTLLNMKLSLCFM